MRMREGERGHPGRPFGVRDMFADVWSWLMETYCGVLTIGPSFPAPGGGPGEEEAADGVMKNRCKMTLNRKMA